MNSVMFSMCDTDAKPPTRGTPGSAGFDLYSAKNYMIRPHCRQVCSTGIEIIMPKGFYGRLADLSSLALLKGLMIAGGVIDSDYDGEILVLLVNTSNEDVTISKGDRIAQIIIETYLIDDPMIISSYLRDSILRLNNRSRQGFGVQDTRLLPNTNSN